MTAPLDFLVTWIERLLGFLPDPLAEFLWLPVLMVVLVLGIRLFLRAALPWLAETFEKALNVALAVAAAPLMAVLVAISAPMRRVKLNPPNFVLAADDAIVATTTVAATGLRRGVGFAGKVSQAHILLIVALSIAVVWRWNAAQCEQPDGAVCVTPVVEWAKMVGIGEDEQAPAPDVTPLPGESPAPVDSPPPVP